MQRDADGDQFFGFCGMRVYVPDDDPHAEGIADGVLRRFRERLAESICAQPLMHLGRQAMTLPPLPEPGKPDDNGLGWFTAG